MVDAAGRKESYLEGENAINSDIERKHELFLKGEKCYQPREIGRAEVVSGGSLEGEKMRKYH